MNLFQLGRFQLHSGTVSPYKIDTDALSDSDIETLAHYIAHRANTPFHEVIGVPQGGLRLAEAMQKYKVKRERWTGFLIVDDVLTTGQSMWATKRSIPRPEEPLVYGWVIFSRTDYLPYWVRAIFTADMLP